MVDWSLAACNARTAADAGDRAPEQFHEGRKGSSHGRALQRPGRSRICRRQERGDRSSLCRPPAGSPSGSGRRADPPSRGGDRRRQHRSVGREKRHDDADRVRQRRRPGQGRPCCEPQPARGPRHRRVVPDRRGVHEALRTAAPACPEGYDDRGLHTPGHTHHRCGAARSPGRRASGRPADRLL